MLVTLQICFISIICASILALLTALGRLSRFAPFYALSTFYVSLIRGTPLLLQIFFFFLALPQLGIVLPRHVGRGIIALSLNYGAYMSEIFRAGIQSVSKGQREAALALGMTQGQTDAPHRAATGAALCHPAGRQRIHRHAERFIAGVDDWALCAI